MALPTGPASTGSDADVCMGMRGAGRNANCLSNLLPKAEGERHGVEVWPSAAQDLTIEKSTLL